VINLAIYLFVLVHKINAANMTINNSQIKQFCIVE